MEDELLLPSAFTEAVDMDATSERLTELARYGVLQPLIAANPATPAVILEQLGKSSDATIRRAVAQNPNTPVSLLCSLAGEFPQEFLRNPLIPILNMTSPRFIHRLSVFSWASLLRFENIPALWLQQIKIDTSYQYRWPEVWKLLQLHVTQTGSIPGSWQTEAGSALIGYRKKARRSVAIDPVAEMEIFLLFSMLFPGMVPMLKEQWLNAAKTQPRLTAVALALCTTPGDKNVRALLTEENSFVLCQIARHSRTSAKILDRLTVHKRSEIRRAVASNPHTGSENIAVLLSDPDPTVRRMAVAHPSLRDADHEMMLQDEDASVRAALAVQSRLDHALLTQLVGDSSARVRAACARNLKLPAEMLTTLAHDPAAVVRASVAAHPRLPRETQSVLLSDPEEAVRASLSGNARLLEECAIQLAQDTSLRVRTYLAANPRLPTMLFDQLWLQEEQAIWSGLARQPHISPEFLTRLAQRGDVHVRAIVAAHKRTPVD
ncbi:hypothetical protein ccbrp13_00210 [Ktedonobacteria bacterium brp13]|nr:hypothetical protein ccbrp13_00210 [Ktedonobacteria bacterium brp13]